MVDLSGFYCPRCGVGRCRPSTATYMRLHRGMLITVPDSPAYICDYCNYHEFERAVIQQLRTLTGEETPAVNDTPRPLKSALNESPEPNETQPKP